MDREWKKVGEEEERGGAERRGKAKGERRGLLLRGRERREEERGRKGGKGEKWKGRGEKGREGLTKVPSQPLTPAAV